MRKIRLNRYNPFSNPNLLISNAISAFTRVIKKLQKNIEKAKAMIQENREDIRYERAKFEKFETKMATENDQLAASITAADNAINGLQKLLNGEL